MKKKNERHIAILLAVMMIFMNFIITPVMAEPKVVAINGINFPDETFRNYVKTTTTINTNGDDALTQDELVAVTVINVEEKGIANLKGIEYFTELKKLYCNKNRLTALDLSKNTNLETLNCQVNKLTSLDLSENTNLTTLDCMANQLTSLDLSENKNLENLFCRDNQLTTLDLKNNKNLTTLNCMANKLTSLDLSENKNLTTLNCVSTDLSALDLSENKNLKNLYCDHNQLTTLDLSKNTKLTAINCQVNQLTALDLSNNINLEILYCDENQLTTLDLSNNINLKELYCDENQLTTLDLSNNPKVSVFSGYTQVYDIKVSDSTLKFDLRSLPGNFDPSMASSWDGGTVEGNILTLKETRPSKVKYNYDVNHKYKSISVTLNVEYGNFVTVSFDNDGGTGSMNSKVISKGSNYTLPACTFTPPTGKEFDKWDVNGVEKAVGETITVDTDIIVKANWKDKAVIDSIAVNSITHKTAYTKGEALDVSNLTILVTMSDGETRTENVTADMVSGFEPNTEGTQTLTITYEGQTTTYNVTVTAGTTPSPTVDSIAVNSITHKTAYTKGEPLDVSNLTIEVTMSDSTKTTKNVTADMVSGFDKDTEGTQTLTITYEGKTTSYNVTVTAGTTPPTPTPTPEPYYPGYYDDWYEPYRPYKPHRPYRPAEDKKTEEKSEEKPIDKPANKIETEVIFVIGSNNMDTKINGTDSFKGMDAAPYIKNGRTMLPIRYIAEALGMSVSWDAKTRTVIIQDMFYTVEIPVDTNKIIVNGEVFTSDVKPEIVHGRTMLPIANIARALGLKDGKDIIWDASKRQVIIKRIYDKKEN